MHNDVPIRQRRLAAGLSLQRLAELAGVSISTVQLHDRGYSPARSEARVKVLAALERIEAKSDSGWELRPGIGVSGYRGDTAAP